MNITGRPSGGAGAVLDRVPSAQTRKICNLSWNTRLHPPTDEDSAKCGDFVISQWKSYPGEAQNHPLLFRMFKHNGQLQPDLIHSNEKRQWM